MRRASRTRRKSTEKRRVSRNAKESVEQIIETRFNRLEDKLDTFKDEINEWKQEFVKQLTKLNTNMESVLNTIAEHEARITKLEQSKIANDTKVQTISNVAKFGWTAAKTFLAIGAVIGAVGGCGWILKLLAVI